LLESIDMSISRLSRTFLSGCWLGATLVCQPALADDCNAPHGSKPEQAAAKNGACSPSPRDERGRALSTQAVQEDRVAEAHFFGVRGTETWSRSARTPDRSLGVTASIRHFDYDARGLFSGRSVGSAFIGGGSAGFEGGLGGALGAGLRVPFGRSHGVVARLGLEGHLLGNDRFYASMLELPQGQVGYQLLSKSLLVELSGTLGPVLTGRYRTSAASAGTLGGMLETGARLGLGFRNAHLELAYSRYERTNEVPLQRLDRVAGSVCGMASVIGICADIEYFDRHSDSTPAGSGDTAYLGLHVGVLTGQRTLGPGEAAPEPKPQRLRRSASGARAP
jgi:hypothetical protein